MFPHLRVKANFLTIVQSGPSLYLLDPGYKASGYTPFRMAIIKNLQTINAGEGVEKRELSCTVGGNVNWYSHYGEQYRGSLKKLKIELPYDPAIPLLGIYLEKTLI